MRTVGLLSTTMKSHLSYILPVWKASEILGEPVVRRMVASLVHLRHNSAANRALLGDSGTSLNYNNNNPNHNNSLEQDIELLTKALFYHVDEDKDPTAVPSEIAHAWKRWLNARNLVLDKATLIQFVVPHTVQPHAGPSGHMGLFDCWVYALQGHAMTSATTYYGGANNTLITLPDVIILLAAAHNYCTWTDGGQNLLIKKRSEGEEEEDFSERSAMTDDDGMELQNPANSASFDSQEVAAAEQAAANVIRQPPSNQSKTTSPQSKAQVPSLSPCSRKKSAVAEALKARQEIGGMHQSMVDEALEATSVTIEPSNSQESAASKGFSWRRFQYESQEAVRAMALLAFRLYDAYQKKGAVARDTVHRFLTDVHGEDSYKESPAKDLLDTMFSDPSLSDTTEVPVVESLQMTVSESTFVARIVDSFDYERRTHLLLDWMAHLINSMVPLEEIPASVTAYLENMERRPKPLCEVYRIAEGRLFEVKRRFHSLVRSGPSVIQGDPMGGGETAAEQQHQQSNQHQQSPQSYPKHTIRQSTFVEAVTSSNEEMGHGGYLPPSLAELVFQAGSQNMAGEASAVFAGSSHSGKSMSSSASSAEEESSWTLPNLLQFGCTAVRQKASASQKPEMQDVAILRFLFQVFAFGSRQEMGVQKGAIVDVDSTSSNPEKLTRVQMERMILLMVEHMEFRLSAESSASGKEKRSRSKSAGNGKRDTDDVMVDLEPSYLLGLLPPKMDRSDSKKVTLVSLKKLVDYALESTEDGEHMSFEEFCAWNADAPDGGPRSRLSNVIYDLRLIASVLFGIPPTLASLEVSLIAEIERRHKARYPQTNVSRRGPRGTIWHIIDAEWLRKWAHAVKELADTDQDGVDGRDQAKGAVRGLGRIENASLVLNGSLALRQDIQWKHDYEILPPMAWQAMQAWYDGGPPIHRSVVRYVDNSKQTTKQKASANSKSRMPTENEIELYPYFVTVYLCDSQSGGEKRPFQQHCQLSRVSPVGIMLDQLCKELEVDPSMARLWVLGSGSESSLASDEPIHDWILNREENIVDQRKKRLDPSQIKKDIQLLLELKEKETGQWPRGEDGKSWTDRASSDGKNIQTENLGDGIVGLYNMGNTCFLNSSIQCISHTPIFREYFTSKAYLNDINTTNPLGHQGQLAQVSAVLINSLWKPYHQSALSSNTKRITTPGSYALVQTQSLTPKTFKDSLGKFNELFSGNEQHDAQELLTFLLAGLSEDLNRIVDKPYIEAPDSDGRPDKELADIWWANHLQRELSIVVALFNGQYKNLLTCRTCKYESARFEPFSTLTVPLPEDDSIRASVIVYPYSEAKEPTKYCVRVSGSGNLGDILIEVAKLLLKDEGVEIDEEIGSGEDAGKEGEEDGENEVVSVDPRVVQKAKDLSIVDMRDSYIFRIAPLTWQLQDLQNKDTGDLPVMHAYELGELPTTDDDAPTDKDAQDQTKSKSGYLAISQRRSDLLSRDYLHPLSHKLFGTPILLRLSEIESCTGRTLYDMVAKRLRPLVPKGALRFLESQNKESVSSSISIEKGGESSGMTRSPPDAETVSAGPVPRYGFRLRVTSRDGRRCLVCPWYKCCVGCLIHDNDSIASVMDGDSLVVDWHFAVDVATLGFGARSGLLDPIASRPNPGTRLLKPTPVAVKTHPSCGIGGKGSHAGAITLESCLQAFAKEERIPEAYCSKCKEFRVQTTRMTLWRLPPVLIIHLKRFQFTSTMRRKLRDLVVFPLEGLDLSCIMEQDGAQSSGINQASKASGSKEPETDDSTAASSTNDKQLYDLYGVIHHQGALSGGHYVASLKSEIDGQWRLFNDAQIYEIHARDVIDASAYILFYMRRDVAENARLSDFWDLKQVATLNEEEMENLVKGKNDRCTIQ